MILWAVYNLTIWAELHFHSLILQVGVKELQVSFQWLRIIARQTWKVIKVFSLLCLQIVDSGFFLTEENTCHSGGLGDVHPHAIQVGGRIASEHSPWLTPQAWGYLE